MSASESELLDELRPRAFAIAYRMLGSVSEAEDIVQEALLRVHTATEQGEEISSPRAYTATIVTRLAIDELRSALRDARPTSASGYRSPSPNPRPTTPLSTLSSPTHSPSPSSSCSSP
jgi:DNA-directed RNA polymerase specialized sigma subunit, sigma24 homolog